MIVSVSYLKSNESQAEMLKKLDNSSCEMIHVDLTDGVFAGEKNYEIPTILSLLQFIRKPLEFHFMLKNPEVEIESMAILKPKYMIVHVEIDSVEKQIQKIKAFGSLVGLSINPETPLEVLEPFLKQVSLILVMGVNPGYGGQKYIQTTTEKLKKLNKIRREQNLSFKISLDGGVNESVKNLVKPYCDILVSGAYVCMSDNIEEKIKSLR